MDPVVLSEPGKVRLELLPPLALYVHIPWCVRKCPYCDFNSHERGGELPEREYVAKLLTDLEELLPSVWGRRLLSVFIGGGTPSLFSPEAIDELLSGVRARVPHISAYQLTIEPNTVFYSHPPRLPEHDTCADMQLVVEETLARAGYEHYETSAFARPGHRCRHNVNYWEFGDYLGIGAGAHGKVSFPDRVTRHERIKQPRDYLASASTVAKETTVPSAELPFEFMLNALRLIEGFPVTLFRERTGLPLHVVERRLRDAEQKG